MQDEGQKIALHKGGARQNSLFRLSAGWV